MARGRSHLPLTIKHLNHSMFWTIWSNQACTEIAGEPTSRKQRRTSRLGHVFQSVSRIPERAKLTTSHRVRNRERIPSQQVDVIEDQW
jgi:hypothetical protein